LSPAADTTSTGSRSSSSSSIATSRARTLTRDPSSLTPPGRIVVRSASVPSGSAIAHQRCGTPAMRASPAHSISSGEYTPT
jgi:hypothetical protein